VQACFEFFLGGDQSKPCILEVPNRFIPTYPDHFVFPRKFPQKYTMNKNDLNILELERSDNQNLFGGKNGVQFVMLLSFSVILNEVTFEVILF